LKIYRWNTEVNRRRRLRSQALAIGLLALGTLGTSWSATPIYKCFDRKSDVVYTDEPCKDGAPLDIRAGEADPAAVARLERVRDALDQSAAERIRDMRWAAAPPAYALPWGGGTSGGSWADYPAMSSPYDYGVGLVGFASNYPFNARQRRPFNPRGVAFAHPNGGGHR
jgi:hypothetical protein